MCPGFREYLEASPTSFLCRVLPSAFRFHTNDPKRCPERRHALLCPIAFKTIPRDSGHWAHSAGSSGKSRFLSKATEQVNMGGDKSILSTWLKVNAPSSPWWNHPDFTPSQFLNRFLGIMMCLLFTVYCSEPQLLRFPESQLLRGSV